MKRCRLLFFDLETHPTRNPATVARLAIEASEKEPPKGATKAEKAEWHTEENRNARMTESWEKTAVNPMLAEILVACVAVDEGPVQSFEAYEDDAERELLRDLRDCLEARIDKDTILIGHNVEHFDLAVLLNAWRRHGIAPPRDFPVFFNGRWSGRVFDTMKRTPGPTPYISMEAACEVCGLELDPVMWDGAPMEGSRVLAAYKACAYEELTAYCAEDVRATRELYLAMTAYDTWGTWPRLDDLAEQLAEIERADLSEGQKALAQKQALQNAGRWPR